jgi:hypothetical protein
MTTTSAWTSRTQRPFSSRELKPLSVAFPRARSSGPVFVATLKRSDRTIEAHELAWPIWTEVQPAELSQIRKNVRSSASTAGDRLRLLPDPRERRALGMPPANVARLVEGCWGMVEEAGQAAGVSVGGAETVRSVSGCGARSATSPRRAQLETASIPASAPRVMLERTGATNSDSWQSGLKAAAYAGSAGVVGLWSVPKRSRFDPIAGTQPERRRRTAVAPSL